jgi:hypothetical protein
MAIVGFAVDAARGLHAYRADQSRKAGGSIRRPLLQTPLPLLLRLLYLACTIFFLLGHTGQTTANWLHVSPRTRQADVVHQAAPGDLRLDGASWFCLIVVGKFAPLNYVFCKFMCYCFFFIKVRGSSEAAGDARNAAASPTLPLARRRLPWRSRWLTHPPSPVRVSWLHCADSNERCEQCRPI